MTHDTRRTGTTGGGHHTRGVSCVSNAPLAPRAFLPPTDHDLPDEFEVRPRPLLAFTFLPRVPVSRDVRIGPRTIWLIANSDRNPLTLVRPDNRFLDGDLVEAR